MNYHHLSIEERSCIRKYYVDGLSYREIARLIGRNVSAVLQKIRRNCTHMYDTPTYYPHTVRKKYLLRHSYCHRGMFRSQEVIDYINGKLKATWSPEQIASNPCELKMPSWRTIYRWIYEKYLVNGNLKVLRRKGKSHGVKETRGKYRKGKSIRKRDKSVYSRQEAGHWEADTVVSGQGKSKACFATLAECKTRFYIAVKIPDQKPRQWKMLFLLRCPPFPLNWSRLLLVIEVRSSPTGLRLKNDSILPLLRKQLADTNRGIENMLNAIQQGILTSSTKERLEELEKLREELKTSILQAELEQPKYSREDIVEWLSRFKYGDPNSKEYQRQIIDIFLNSIYVFDDQAIWLAEYRLGR